MEYMKLKDLVRQVSREEVVISNKEYPLLGVRLYGDGPFHRETKLGSSLSASKLYRVETGDFIYSRLFAWRGAFGIVPPALDGHYVSNEFPVFLPNSDRIDVRYLLYWFLLPETLMKVEDDCTGTTKQSRNRYKEKYFLASNVPVPDPNDQARLVNIIEYCSESEAIARKVISDMAHLKNSVVRDITLSG